MANHVVMLESPALARALFKYSEISDEIPAALYTAVAQVLAYVFQLRAYNTHGGLAPVRPEQIEVPVGMDPLAS
jgi:flagellar biosynthetic protein FlhB